MHVRRNSWMLFVCLLPYCFFPASGHAIDAETRLQNITVVSDDNYPPYIFRNSNGVIQGILVDEWKLWEKKTGIKVNLIAMDWSNAQEFLLRGNADVIDTIFFTEERAKQYDFTKPYATIDVPVFFHKNLSGIVDIESLRGFTIGVKAGDACIEVLKKHGITSLQEYNSYETIVNAAVDGEVKVFSIDKPPALYYLYKMNFENEFRYSFNLYTGEFHRAVKKGRTDILKIVEAGFALINRKEHDGIKKKWMGEPLVQPVYLRYVLFSLLFAGVVFLVLLFFNITLRRKVRSRTSELQDLVNQLRLSEERFRSMFEQAAVGVALCNSKTGDYVRVNQRYCDIVGYNQQEINKLSFQEIIHPDDLQEDLDKMNLLLEGKIQNFTQEKRYFRKDGSLIWVKITVSPMRNADEEINFHIAIVEDITWRKLAEETVRDSEEKYKELTDSLPQVVFETDTTGKLTFINQNAFDLFGYTEEEFDKGLNALQMIIPEEREFALENMQKVMNGNLLGGVEYTALRKDGTAFPVIIHSNRFMRGNKPIGLRGLIIDLSKSKKMETVLKRRAMAMDQSTETIVITDDKGLITYVNPAFEKTTGYSREEALGKNPRILQSGVHNAMFYNELWKTLSKGKTWSGRFVNKKKDGAIYTEEATISPVFSDKGEIVNYVAVKRDISDKLKLESQLQQAQKMEAIGTLAGGIAHDFNNILSPIFGYTEMLMLDAPDDSQLKQGLTQVLTAAKTARNLIKQILSFSRQSEHEKKPVKVQLVIKEALKLVRSSLPATIDIDEDISNDCGLILADPTQIHQIFMNLCTNAYQALDATGGILKVVLENVQLEAEDVNKLAIDAGAYICLTVADTGMGMNQGTMDRIFDPYFTTKEEGKGTGLGLAVVHGIVKNHCGHISVNSEPDKGTEFKVYLPVVKAQAEIADKITPMPIEKGTERVLIIDDKEEIVFMIKSMLEKLGYQVTPRTSSIEALEAFRTQPDKFDLVITDMTMPNMTGDKLAGELMKIRPDIPVILCTGFSEKISKEKAESIGIKGFLMKPVLIIKLSQMIRKILDDKGDSIKG